MRATKAKSKRPESTRCRGISVNGQPCRRAVAASGTTDEDGNQYCHSHRAQAFVKDLYNIRASKDVLSSDSEDDKDHQDFRPENADADDDNNSDVVFLSDTESDADQLELLAKNMQTLGLATPQRPVPSTAVGVRQDSATERSATVNISASNSPQTNTTVIVIYSDSTPEITISGNQQSRLITSELSPIRRLEAENTSSTPSQWSPLSNDNYLIRAQDPTDEDNPFISDQRSSNLNININKPLPATPPVPQPLSRHSIPLLPQPREPLTSSPTSSSSPSSSTASPSPNTQKKTSSPFPVVNRQHINSASDNSDTLSIKGLVNNFKSLWHQPRKHQSTTVSHESDPSPSGSSVQTPPHLPSRSTDPTPLPDAISPYAADARESQPRAHSTPTPLKPVPRTPSPPSPSARGRARSSTPLDTPGASVQCKGIVRKSGKQCTNRVRTSEGGKEGALAYCHHHRPESVRERLVFVDPKMTLVHVDGKESLILLGWNSLAFMTPM